MAYIFGFIVVGLIFLALHYFTELTRSQKLIVAGVFTLFISSAIMYNLFVSKEQEKVLAVIQKYKQGQTLHCKGIDVNASMFDLSNTNTFIGKKNTPHYLEIIRAQECK
ncbi:hypothetical protein [Sulfurimonas sp.]|uniref:hypothetical protein n=1 Tax=Sulfurimonas sp. TaxID=2022749 RepID=UPI003D0DD3D7